MLELVKGFATTAWSWTSSHVSPQAIMAFVVGLGGVLGFTWARRDAKNDAKKDMKLEDQKNASDIRDRVSSARNKPSGSVRNDKRGYRD